MAPLRSWSDLLGDAKAAGAALDPVPDGQYDCVITKCDAGQTQQQKTKFNATCEIEAGPHAKRKIWHNFVVSPENTNALGYFFRNMNVLGLGGDFFAGNPSDEQIAANLVGKRFIAQVGHREWQGKVSNEIKTFSTPRAQSAGPGPSAGPAPAAPAPAPRPAAAPPAPAAPVVAAPAPAAPPAPVAAPTPPPVEQAAPPAAPAAPAAPSYPAPPAPPPF